jgi:Putative lumazine-binding
MRQVLLVLSMLFPLSSMAAPLSDREAVKRAAEDYIVSQHKSRPELMKRGADKELIKRTYWKSKEETPFILVTDYPSMVKLAATYNVKKDGFPAKPKIEIDVYDIDQRVASVKLVADEWIDYMHLYKNEQGEWKILNVLWQFNDINRHKSK